MERNAPEGVTIRSRAPTRNPQELTMVTRRQALAAAAGGALFLSKARKGQANQSDSSGRGWAKSYSGGPPDVAPQPPGEPGRDYSPTITPNGVTLPFKVIGGVKV